jgi:hypothetical protein
MFVDLPNPTSFLAAAGGEAQKIAMTAPVGISETGGPDSTKSEWPYILVTQIHTRARAIMGDGRCT